MHDIDEELKYQLRHRHRPGPAAIFVNGHLRGCLMQYINIWKETPERQENILYMETSLPLHLYLLNAELALQANL